MGGAGIPECYNPSDNKHPSPLSSYCVVVPIEFIPFQNNHPQI